MRIRHNSELKGARQSFWKPRHSLYMSPFTSRLFLLRSPYDGRLKLRIHFKPRFRCYLSLGNRRSVYWRLGVHSDRRRKLFSGDSKLWCRRVKTSPLYIALALRIKGASLIQQIRIPVWMMFQTHRKTCGKQICTYLDLLETRRGWFVSFQIIAGGTGMWSHKCLFLEVYLQHKNRLGIPI